MTRLMDWLVGLAAFGLAVLAGFVAAFGPVWVFG
jgi:hypothetical protein